jgi:Holliday junction resolvasome RuvABC DNA-binding subunit
VKLKLSKVNKLPKANKQTSKQTNKQANKQTIKQTKKPMNIFKVLGYLPRKIRQFYDDVLSLIKANSR